VIRAQCQEKTGEKEMLTSLYEVRKMKYRIFIEIQPFKVEMIRDGYTVAVLTC